VPAHVTRHFGHYNRYYIIIIIIIITTTTTAMRPSVCPGKRVGHVNQKIKIRERSNSVGIQLMIGTACTTIM